MIDPKIVQKALKYGRMRNYRIPKLYDNLCVVRIEWTEFSGYQHIQVPLHIGEKIYSELNQLEHQ